jgi:predicted DNA-binding protein (MmcQ/YjbR family)
MTADIDWIRSICLPLPGVTEQIQWGYDLVFKVGGKMFAVVPTEPAPVVMSFKVPDEEFPELTERLGVIPAPYMARAKWIALESESALPRPELERLLKLAHRLVLAKHSKKMQAKILGTPRAEVTKPKGKRTAKFAKRRSSKSKRKSRN